MHLNNVHKLNHFIDYYYMISMLIPDKYYIHYMQYTKHDCSKLIKIRTWNEYYRFYNVQRVHLHVSNVLVAFIDILKTLTRFCISSYIISIV